MTLEIRELVSQDVSGLAILERNSTEYGWTEQDLHRSIESNADGYTVSSGERMLGYCVVRLVADEVEILNIVVDEAEQGNGTGGFLVEQVLGMEKYSNAARAWLEVADGNEAALALYRRLGFATEYVRRKYYKRGNETLDARVMTRELSADLSGGAPDN